MLKIHSTAKSKKIVVMSMKQRYWICKLAEYLENNLEVQLPSFCGKFEEQRTSGYYLFTQLFSACKVTLV